MTAVCIAVTAQLRAHRFSKKEVIQPVKWYMFSKHTQRLILWAFILNTIWEFVQCMFLYGMWDWPFWEATICMWVAIFGDILIVLGLWKITTLLIPSVRFELPGFMGYLSLLILSFLASIVLKWVAIFLDLWHYTPAMPVVTIFNHEVGLSPILQITFLPVLSIYLANRFYTRTLTEIDCRT